MKIFFIFFPLVFSCIICFSQRTRINKRDSSIILNPDNFDYNLEISENNKFAGKFPFQKILFYDVRYDTSFIAINWQVNSQPKMGRVFKKKLNLSGGLGASLTNYFNSFYQNNTSSSNNQLVCFIKKFSITLKPSLAGDRFQEAQVSDFNVELECYYKLNNKLFPAIRYDTTYEKDNSRIDKTFLKVVQQMMLPFIQRVNKIDSASIVKRNSYSEEQIQKKYQSRFNIPILTADHYIKGVYKSFNEFKNNAPSITDFRIKNRGEGVSLYDSSNSLINNFEIFGFCDGKTCWIQHGEFCYPLVRFDNSFEFLYQVDSHTSSALVDYVFPTFKFLLALNMDTGKID